MHQPVAALVPSRCRKQLYQLGGHQSPTIESAYTAAPWRWPGLGSGPPSESLAVGQARAGQARESPGQAVHRRSGAAEASKVAPCLT